MSVLIRCYFSAPILMILCHLECAGEGSVALPVVMGVMVHHDEPCVMSISL